MERMCGWNEFVKKSIFKAYVPKWAKLLLTHCWYLLPSQFLMDPSSIKERFILHFDINVGIDMYFLAETSNLNNKFARRFSSVYGFMFSFIVVLDKVLGGVDKSYPYAFMPFILFCFAFFVILYIELLFASHGVIFSFCHCI